MQQNEVFLFLRLALYVQNCSYNLTKIKENILSIILTRCERVLIVKCMCKLLLWLLLQYCTFASKYSGAVLCQDFKLKCSVHCSWESSSITVVCGVFKIIESVKCPLLTSLCNTIDFPHSCIYTW